MEEQFTTGSTLACWMVGLGGRLELLQIPEPKPAADAFGDEHYVGYYHLSFEVGTLAKSLPAWMSGLKDKLDAIDQSLGILLAPQQQMIGDRVVEVAFIADPDGLPIEFLYSPHPDQGKASVRVSHNLDSPLNKSVLDINQVLQ